MIWNIWLQRCRKVYLFISFVCILESFNIYNLIFCIILIFCHKSGNPPRGLSINQTNNQNNHCRSSEVYWNCPPRIWHLLESWIFQSAKTQNILQKPENFLKRPSLRRITWHRWYIVFHLFFFCDKIRSQSNKFNKIEIILSFHVSVIYSKKYLWKSC